MRAPQFGRKPTSLARLRRASRAPGSSNPARPLLIFPEAAGTPYPGAGS
jgi:hypothetical protein